MGDVGGRVAAHAKPGEHHPQLVHLRDFDGNVHSLPFGEAQPSRTCRSTSPMRWWTSSIAYRGNIDEALAVSVAEVKAGHGEEAVRRWITPPSARSRWCGRRGPSGNRPAGWGRFETRPLGQWNVRREFYWHHKASGRRGLPGALSAPDERFRGQEGGALPLQVVRGEAGATTARAAGARSR